MIAVHTEACELAKSNRTILFNRCPQSVATYRVPQNALRWLMTAWTASSQGTIVTQAPVQLAVYQAGSGRANEEVASPYT